MTGEQSPFTEQPKEENEAILTPLERIQRAKELRNYARFGEAIGDVAKFEVVVRYAEKYPQEKLAGKIERIFKDYEKVEDFSKDPQMTENLKNLVNNYYDYVRNALSEEEFETLHIENKG